MTSNVHLIDHPLVQHKLTLMRRKDASTNTFRRLLNELSALMVYEVTRDMPMQSIEIETPLETMTAKVIDGKKLVFVSILRAGNGILEGMLNVIPGARVGHVGLYRDPKTLVAIEYYFKMPKDMQDRGRGRAGPGGGPRRARGAHCARRPARCSVCRARRQGSAGQAGFCRGRAALG